MRKKILSQSETLRRTEMEATLKRAQLQNIEQNGEKLIGVLDKSWVCEKTEDREEIEVDYKEQIYVPGKGNFQIVDIKKKKVEGVEKNCF